MAITKSILYTFLGDKKTAVIKEKLVPLKEKYSQLERVAALERLEANKIDLDVVSKKYLDILALSEKIESISLKYCSIGYRIRTEISEYSTAELVKNKIVKEIKSEKTDEMRDLEVEIQSVRERIDFQFRQLEALVRANSANKTLKLFKEMGFDVSELDVTPKNEVLALKVDSELLGLPEGESE